MKFIILFIIIAVALFFINKFLSRFKTAKVGALALVTGGVKTGKSTLALSIALREYKSRVRSVKFRNAFRKIFNRPLIDLPLFYCNVPLAMPYVPITTDLLLRKKRFVFGSVIYIQEASLVADSQLIRDMEVNERLLLFNKLIAHMTHNGCLIYDTQSPNDLHYSIKRCLSNYFYIHHLVKWIPFILLAKVQECRYSDDGSTINVSTQDTESTLKTVILSKRVWKYFDSCCYSVLTDNLPVESNVVNNNLRTKDLKCNKITSFRKYKKDGLIDERKDN